MTPDDELDVGEVLGSGFEHRLAVDPDAKERSRATAAAAFEAALLSEADADEIDAFDDIQSFDEADDGRGPGTADVVVLTVTEEAPVERRHWGRWAVLAAALVAAVALVAGLVAQRGDRVRTDVIPPGAEDSSTAIPTPADDDAAPAVTDDDWSSWADGNDPAVVLRCVTATYGRAILTLEVDAPFPAGQQVEDTWLLSQLMGPIRLGPPLADALFGPTGRAPSDAELAALQAAQEAQYADGGQPSEEFAERVTAVVDARETNPLWSTDAGSCWFDRADAGWDTEALADSIGPELALQCLATEMLHRSIAWQLSEPEVDRRAVIEASVVALANGAPEPELVDVLSRVGAAAERGADGSADLAAARTSLRALGLGVDEARCREAGA